MYNSLLFHAIFMYIQTFSFTFFVYWHFCNCFDRFTDIFCNHLYTSSVEYPGRSVFWSLSFPPPLLIFLLSLSLLFSRRFPFFLWKTACLFSGANACFLAVFQKKGGATEERCSPLFLLLSSSFSLSLLLSAAIKGERTGYLELSSSSPVSQINIQIFTQLLVLFFLPRD